MTWTTSNPPPLTDPYDYGDKDLEQIAALIGSGAGNSENYEITDVDFSSINTLGTYPYNTGGGEKKRVFRFGINIPKTVNLVGNENIRIYQNTVNGETDILNQRLIDLIETSVITNTSLNYISDIQNLSSADTGFAVLIEITNIAFGSIITVRCAFSYNFFFVDRTEEVLKNQNEGNVFLKTIVDRSIGRFNNATNVKILTSNNANNLELLLNTNIPIINPSCILGISYTIDPAGGANSHQALITYLL